MDSEQTVLANLYRSQYRPVQIYPNMTRTQFCIKSDIIFPWVAKHPSHPSTLDLPLARAQQIPAVLQSASRPIGRKFTVLIPPRHTSLSQCHALYSSAIKIIQRLVHLFHQPQEQSQWHCANGLSRAALDFIEFPG